MFQHGHIIQRNKILLIRFILHDQKLRPQNDSYDGLARLHRACVDCACSPALNINDELLKYLKFWLAKFLIY